MPSQTVRPQLGWGYFDHVLHNTYWLFFAIGMLCDTSMHNVPAGIALVVAIIVDLPAFIAVYHRSVCWEAFVRRAAAIPAAIGVVLMIYSFWRK